MTGQIGGLFSAGKLDADFYEQLEEALYPSDIGVERRSERFEELHGRVREQRISLPEEAKAALKAVLTEMMEKGDGELRIGTSPSVILVIGVNGVGKTTSIGKLASLLKSQGKKVLLCAADTFRAAAADQLEIWAGRAGVDIVRQNEGADPAAVVFDSISAAKSRGCDVVICDTAGRLHNKQNLMNELNKISRIIDRELPGADRETLLVLDATTGKTGWSRQRNSRKPQG